MLLEKICEVKFLTRQFRSVSQHGTHEFRKYYSIPETQPSERSNAKKLVFMSGWHYAVINMQPPAGNKEQANFFNDRFTFIFHTS